MAIPFSVLDLSPITEGATARDALLNSIDLARHAESLGFLRYWLAEHHNMTGIASAATAVVIGQVAAATSTIRVGSGGIMLPNHSPLQVAEQFGTLESLFPGRIDLGLGRAPGTDQAAARAMRRDLNHAAEHFGEEVLELRHYFGPPQPGQAIKAVPGMGLNVPLWILGSSLYGAQVAAALGLPFAFASHFAPDALEPALQIYRARFRASAQLAQPHVMVAANLVLADSDAEAARLFTSLQQSFVKLRRGQPGPLPPPVEDIRTVANDLDLAGVSHSFMYSFVGTPTSVTPRLRSFLEITRADELIVSGHIFDHAARRRSFELVSGVRASLG
jgi:luciferase family oxidoreductase group 1